MKNTNNLFLSMLTAFFLVQNAPVVTANSVDGVLVGEGCSICDAVRSISTQTRQNMCNYSPGMDTIFLPDGLHEVKRTTHITISSNMKLVGNSKEHTIIKRMDGDKRIFNISNGVKVEFSNLSISGGVKDQGAAIYVAQNADVTITNVIIKDNTTTANGAGLFNNGGKIKLEQVIFTNNHTLGSDGSGGAMYNFNGELNLNQVTIKNNSTQRKGGGIFVLNGKITINNSLIEHNHSQLCGAGVSLANNAAGDFSMANSVMRNNFYKQISPSDLVGAVLLDNITASSIAAFTDSCYKDTFVAIGKYAAGNDGLDIGQTDLNEAAQGRVGGLPNFITANIEGYKQILRLQGLGENLLSGSINNGIFTPGSANTEFEAARDNLKNIVDAVNAAVDNLINHLQNNTLNDSNELYALLQAAGVRNLLSEQKNVYLSAILASAIDGVNILQIVVNTVNNQVKPVPKLPELAELAKIEKTAQPNNFRIEPLPDYYLLTIGSPNGRVYTSPAGIDCDHGQGTCQAMFKRGQRVKLHVEPPKGLYFAGWTGSSSCDMENLIMARGYNCLAHFYAHSATTNTPNELINFSIRGRIQAQSSCDAHTNQPEAEVLVAGFILQNAGLIMLQASPLQAGVNPKLLLKQTIIDANGKITAQPIDTNDNWAQHPNATQIPVVLRPHEESEAALLLNLPAGIYTATACMSEQSELDTGIALISITNLQAQTQINNLSGRGYLGQGEESLIAGIHLENSARLYINGQDLAGNNTVLQLLQLSGENQYDLSDNLLDFVPGSYALTLKPNNTNGMGIISIIK